MTETTPPIPLSAAIDPERRVRGKRRDHLGRAFAGSQMCLQVWVNRRQAELSKQLLRALGITDPDAHVEWKSPLEGPPSVKGFKEYKDGEFLDQFALLDQRAKLREFWPTRGPVWDGLALVRRAGRADLLVLVEAKSYPGEVLGSGCAAGAESRKEIERALRETAAWLGIERPGSWTGSLYQSANRIAYVYFLREVLGRDTVMVNICFTEDKSIRRPTTKKQWDAAKTSFRKSLALEAVATPWLVDLMLEAPSPNELLVASDVDLLTGGA